jgi:hypothetical protein
LLLLENAPPPKGGGAFSWGVITESLKALSSLRVSPYCCFSGIGVLSVQRFRALSLPPVPICSMMR